MLHLFGSILLKIGGMEKMIKWRERNVSAKRQEQWKSKRATEGEIKRSGEEKQKGGRKGER